MKNIIVGIMLVLFMGCSLEAINTIEEIGINDFIEDEQLASLIVGDWLRTSENNICRLGFKETGDKAFINSIAVDYVVIENKIFIDGGFFAKIDSINGNYLSLTQNNRAFVYCRKQD